MQKQQYVFKDTICVEKEGSEDIHVLSFTDLYRLPRHYTQEAANTGCLQAKEMNDKATGGSFSKL